jgi:hypothetical protein
MESYLNKILADPFASFTYSPAGESVYQLGGFGAAQGVEGVDADALKLGQQNHSR